MFREAMSLTSGWPRSRSLRRRKQCDGGHGPPVACNSKQLPGPKLSWALCTAVTNVERARDTGCESIERGRNERITRVDRRSTNKFPCTYPCSDYWSIECYVHGILALCDGTIRVHARGYQHTAVHSRSVRPNPYTSYSSTLTDSI
jgi:hypothetical protein